MRPSAARVSRRATSGQELIDSVERTSSTSCDFGEPANRLAELNHRCEVRVVAVGHAEYVGRQAEDPRDVAKSADITDGPPSGIDHRHIGLVVAQDVGEALLAKSSKRIVVRSRREQMMLVARARKPWWMSVRRSHCSASRPELEKQGEGLFDDPAHWLIVVPGATSADQRTDPALT
jgi:hypothetical protein